MRFQAPRGTEDVLPAQSAVWQHLEAAFRDHTFLYGYREIRTPMFEDRELFLRTSGETSDLVSKEMYDFVDKGGRPMALKPESTAPAMRALVEHSLCPPGTHLRLCYVSSAHFRYDRPQKGRLRQHHQFGVELAGCPDPAADAEVIEVGVRFLERVGLRDLTVKLNSIGREECRQRYREALLAHMEPYLNQAEPEAREKALKNPLRLLDSKDPDVRPFVESAPSILDYLEPESAQRFEALQRLLTEAGIAYEVAPDIVRGLDYYTETVFETQSCDLGAQATVFAGGRYDNLIRDVGGKDTPSVGFGMGVERLILLLEQRGLLPPSPRSRVFVAYSPEGRAKAFALVRSLRSQGVPTLLDLEGRSLKSQMRQADKAEVAFVVILGEEELTTGTASVKDLASGDQRMVPMDQVLGVVR